MNNDKLAEALDHIVRVGLGSRTQSRRIQWIVARAKSALNGDETWRDVRVPKEYHDATQSPISKFVQSPDAEREAVLERVGERATAMQREQTQPAQDAEAHESQHPIEDAVDARRYRWLREGDNDDKVFQRSGDDWDDVFLPRLERLDAAIDAAMAREGGK